MAGTFAPRGAITSGVLETPACTIASAIARRRAIGIGLTVWYEGACTWERWGIASETGARAVGSATNPVRAQPTRTLHTRRTGRPIAVTNHDATRADAIAIGK